MRVVLPNTGGPPPPPVTVRKTAKEAFTSLPGVPFSPRFPTPFFFQLSPLFPPIKRYFEGSFVLLSTPPPPPPFFLSTFFRFFPIGLGLPRPFVRPNIQLFLLPLVVLDWLSLSNFLVRNRSLPKKEKYSSTPEPTLESSPIIDRYLLESHFLPLKAVSLRMLRPSPKNVRAPP